MNEGSAGSIATEPAAGADGPLLETLRATWCETLDMAGHEVRTGDSFFDLGGDSLMMARLLRRVREDVLRNDAERASFLTRVPRFIMDPRLKRLHLSVEAAMGAGGGHAYATR